MVPWLRDLEHIPPANLRRFTRIIPSIQAKVEHIIAVLPPSDDDDSEEEESDDDPMGVTDTPKRSTVLTQAKGASVVLVKVDPGVRSSLFHPIFY